MRSPMIHKRLNRLGRLVQHPPRAARLPRSYQEAMPPDPVPVISMVTPSRDHGRFLAAALDSVLGQRYPALEYNVRDACSEDGSRDVLEARTDELHSWVSRPDGGQAAALNDGFAESTGEIMGWLNADDILLPGSLAYVASYLARHPEVGAVYGHRLVIDADGREVGRQVLPAHDDQVLSWADFVPQETLFWRRSAWDAAGGHFDTSFSCAMDWDLLVRLRDAGVRMVRLPRFLGAFRVHGDQKTIQVGPTQGLAEMDRIRRRIHGREVGQPEVLRRVRGYLLRHVALDQLQRRRLIRY